MIAPVSLPIRRQSDVERARRAARSFAQQLGFALVDCEVIVLATSELATNLVRYATGGAIGLSAVDGARGRGMQVESRDNGPGIANTAQAMADGFSTGGGLGNGLPAVRRLMDTFALTTGPEGTTIVAKKWLPQPS
jgi:anti-sigma regulatory factor (Ser/Thr protein kinase)